MPSDVKRGRKVRVQPRLAADNRIGEHDDDEDDELLSDYAPSELSDIINQEGYSESEGEPEHVIFNILACFSL